MSSYFRRTRPIWYSVSKLSSEQISHLKLGFTIIEFLIIIGLIGIMTTVSIASYNTFNESAKLKNETQKFMTTLSLAQKRAVSGDVGLGCVNCSLNSFTVSWAVATQTYSVVGSRVNGGNPAEPFDQITYSFDSVNKNVTLLSTASVIFSPLTGAPDSAKTVRFKNVTTDECTQVDLAASGLMSSASITCP